MLGWLRRFFGDPRAPFPAALAVSREPAIPALQIEPLPTIREGIPFRFRGMDPQSGAFVDQDLIVPPLNFTSLQALEAKLKAYGSATPTESMSTLADALRHALARNYRGVPEWLISQSIDLENMADLMKALMDISGLRRKALDEGKATAAEATRSTGTASTAT
jgi:hypothetical protein